jgi:hypothetical protein
MPQAGINSIHANVTNPTPTIGLPRNGVEKNLATPATIRLRQRVTASVKVAQSKYGSKKL